MIDSLPDSWYWDYRHQEVRFCAWQKTNLVMCRIARKAIEDRYGGSSTPKTCVKVARQNSKDISDRFGALLTRGRYENDGSLLLRPTDWS